MAYIDQALPHAGSAEVLFSGMFDEPTGTIARTIPRHLITGNTLASFTTGGQVACNALPLPQGMVVTNISILSGSTAAVAPTHFWLALCDVNLNVLGVTADQGSAAIGANTTFKLALTVPVVIPQTGLYYILASVSATTTAPTASGTAIATGAAAGTPVLCGTAGNQATPPAVGTQVNSGTVSNNTTCHFSAWLS